MKLKKFAGCLLAAFWAAAALSCASGPVEIPEGLSAAELIQRGQEASDRNRYEVSLQYYGTVIERFAWDVDSTCAAEYETAFIHYKQKKYSIAKAEFESLLGRYNAQDGELLPPQFKVLSEMLTGRISEIESREAAGG